jgi:O-antigen/teichoic acid export membrane protein
MAGDITDAESHQPLHVGSVHRILRNSTFNLTSQGLYAVFNLVVVLLLARGLGKEAVGDYFLLVALTTVLQLLLEASVSTVTTCRLAQQPSRGPEIVAESAGLFCIIVVVSGVGMALLGLAWAWIGGSTVLLPSFLAGAVGLAAIQVQRFGAGVLRGFEQFGVENVSKVVQGGLFAGAVIVALVLGTASLTQVMVLLALSHIICAIFLLVSVYQQCGWPRMRFNIPMLRSWFAEAGPLGFGDVVRGLTWQLDTVLLGLLQSAAVVGIYSVAYRPLGPLNWLPRAVLTAAFPAFARMASGDRASLDRAFASSIRLLCIVSFPIAVTICIYAEPLIVFLFGAEFLEARYPLRLLIWITTLSYLSMQFRFVFTAVGKLSAFAWLTAIVFLIELVLELILIPIWGYMGACTGSLVGELFFTGVGLAYCRSLGVGRLEWGAMLRAGLAAILMAGVLWPAREANLFVLGLVAALGTLLFFVVCVLLGALRWDEVKRFYEAFAGRLRSRGRGEAVESLSSAGLAANSPSLQP